MKLARTTLAVACLSAMSAQAAFINNGSEANLSEIINDNLIVSGNSVNVLGDTKNNDVSTEPFFTSSPDGSNSTATFLIEITSMLSKQSFGIYNGDDYVELFNGADEGSFTTSGGFNGPVTDNANRAQVSFDISGGSYSVYVNNQKKGIITGKGVLNNRISEFLMTRLNEIGVPTHFIRRLNMREQLVREVEIVPLEVIVRNVAAGSFSERFKMEEGTALPRSIIEFCFKNDEMGDPFVTEEHITAFGWATPQEIDDIMAQTIRINDFLTGLFLGIGIRLVDFKIEFGRIWEGEMMRIILADEISPDSCRLWDASTNEKMDKDRFRRDMGGIEEAYQEVARRLGVMPENQAEFSGPKLVH